MVIFERHCPHGQYFLKEDQVILVKVTNKNNYYTIANAYSFCPDTFEELGSTCISMTAMLQQTI